MVHMCKRPTLNSTVKYMVVLSLFSSSPFANHVIVVPVTHNGVNWSDQLTVLRTFPGHQTIEEVDGRTVDLAQQSQGHW